MGSRAIQLTAHERERIVQLYREGYGAKYISNDVFGGYSPRRIRRALTDAGAELRGMKDGKAASSAYRNRYAARTEAARLRNEAAGVKSKEQRKEMAKARAETKSRIMILPLFSAENPTMERVRKAKVSDSFRKRYRDDPAFRIKEVLRCRFRKIVDRGRGGKGEELLGCSYGEFRQYIESQWREGMTWDNYGGNRPMHGRWHIDHIVPCAWFDHTNSVHVSACWHYSNLRPEWAIRNVVRSDTLSISDIEALRSLPNHEITETLIAGAVAAMDVGVRAWMNPIGDQDYTVAAQFQLGSCEMQQCSLSL